MTLTQMLYFQTVCKYENYSKAANALFVSQPAVSQAVKDIEKECGTSLIERKGNGLMITEAGQTLLEEVNNILRHVDNLNSMISSASLSRNFVRVGISTFSSSSVFPRICAEFHVQYPYLHIITKEDSTSELFAQLDANRLDLIITSPRIPLEELGQKYKYHVLARSGLRYYVSNSHRWANRDNISLEEIASEPLILLSDNYTSSQSLQKMFSEKNLHPNVILKTNQMFTIERFVEAGAAGGFLPAEIAQTNKNIVPLSFSDKQQKSNTLLIWPKKDVSYSAVSSFIMISKKLYPDKLAI